jgi:hypothetical protein
MEGIIGTPSQYPQFSAPYFAGSDGDGTQKHGYKREKFPDATDSTDNRQKCEAAGSVLRKRGKEIERKCV